MANHLLSLPGGIHFRELILPWICDQDMPSMMDLISACSHTLESLHVLNHTKQENTRHSLDLSSALNLKSVVFRCGMSSLNVDWITVAIKSIKSPHVKEMRLHMPGDLTGREDTDAQLPDAVYAQWLALDKVFVKYLTARSFKLKVVAPHRTDRGMFEACVQRLLPNMFGKKMLEVAQIVRT